MVGFHYVKRQYSSKVLIIMVIWKCDNLQTFVKCYLKVLNRIDDEGGQRNFTVCPIDNALLIRAEDDVEGATIHHPPSTTINTFSGELYASNTTLSEKCYYANNFCKDPHSVLSAMLWFANFNG